jgi:hypothetical protein
VELKLEDLIQPCPRCAPRDPLKPVSRLSVAPGQVPGATTDACRKCKGTGVVITPSGEAMLQFLELAKFHKLISFG